MKITLETEKEVVVVKELKKTITEITVNQINDLPQQKKVEVYTNELGLVVLWEGAQYDSIGQWTDTDVINKLKSL